MIARDIVWHFLTDGHSHVPAITAFNFEKERTRICASPAPVSSVDVHYLTRVCLSCIFIPPFLKAGSSELTLNA